MSDSFWSCCRDSSWHKGTRKGEKVRAGTGKLRPGSRMRPFHPARKTLPNYIIYLHYFTSAFSLEYPRFPNMWRRKWDKHFSPYDYVSLILIHMNTPSTVGTEIFQTPLNVSNFWLLQPFAKIMFVQYWAKVVF